MRVVAPDRNRVFSNKLGKRRHVDMEGQVKWIMPERGIYRCLLTVFYRENFPLIVIIETSC